MNRIALVGNPNSGKTTLFNRLTGARQSTGNWAGVTIEKKSGRLKGSPSPVELVDLPGAYSLSPGTPDEVITSRYLHDEQPEMVINIVDATNLERNLFLTLQLKNLGLPLVVVLNMIDELGNRALDAEKLSQLLGVPVYPISARSGHGMPDLFNSLPKLLAAPSEKPDASPVEISDQDDTEMLSLYRQAGDISKAVLVAHPASHRSKTDRIDRLLTHRILAIPLFLLIMGLVFQLTFGEQIGGRLTEWMGLLFDDIVSPAIGSWLSAAQSPEWIRSLLLDGIVSGVGGILTFLPQIALLFFFLSLLEDSGYMARAAFIMDRLFQHLGLSGRSFIPMLMGFGCTVPAVMAARTLENERERRMTILITPFMSCGARMPIYAYFTAIFFSGGKGLITFALYLGGILVAIGSAFILSKVVKSEGESSFIIELPPYRLPDAKSLLLHVYFKVRDFIVRAGTVIFVMTIVVWVLNTFNFSFAPAASSSESMLGRIGSLLAPLLAPLGFGTWEAAVALLTGLIAKESVVATMQILYTTETLQTAFTALSALAFMTFTLLYTPCLAALGTIHREMNSGRWTLAAIAYQTGVAWIMAMLVFQVGSLVATVA